MAGMSPPGGALGAPAARRPARGGPSLLLPAGHGAGVRMAWHCSLSMAPCRRELRPADARPGSRADLRLGGAARPGRLPRLPWSGARTPRRPRRLPGRRPPTLSARVVGEALELRSKARRGRRRAERRRRAGDPLAHRLERRQDAAGVDVAPVEGEQGDPSSMPAPCPGRRAVAQPGPAQDLERRPAPSAAARGPHAGHRRGRARRRPPLRAPGSRPARAAERPAHCSWRQAW